MHIEVNQSMQKIAANKTRKFNPEEIDWLLNKSLERFIHSKVTPRKDGSGGFEVLSHDVDAIQPLINRGVMLNVFRQSPNVFSSILPGDYAFLLADSSVLKCNCGGLNTTESVNTESLLVIPFKKSLTTSGPYYATVQLILSGSTAFNVATYTQDRDTSFSGFNSSEQIYEFISHILPELRKKGYDAYWENYGEFTFPRSLIIVTKSAIAGSIQFDSTTTNGISKSRSYVIEDLLGVDVETQANRLTASNKIPSLQQAAFFKTQAESPISELAGGILSVYTDKTFIVSNTVVSYVRKPRRISLTLGQDCELAPMFHQTICDLTVEYIKAMITDPNWEVKLKDNLLRSPT